VFTLTVLSASGNDAVAAVPIAVVLAGKRKAGAAWRATANLQDLAYLARRRRNEKRDDSRSWVLTGDASGGDWCRRRRLSPAVGLAAATLATGILVARGNREGGSRALEKEKKEVCHRSVVVGVVTGIPGPPEWVRR